MKEIRHILKSINKKRSYFFYKIRKSPCSVNELTFRVLPRTWLVFNTIIIIWCELFLGVISHRKNDTGMLQNKF